MPARSALRPTSGVTSAGSRREAAAGERCVRAEQRRIRLEDPRLELPDRGRRIETELVAQD